MQAEINIGTAGHVDHGKTSLIYALTQKWADQHSEELKRGITIRLGYANFKIRKCKKGGEITSLKKCLKHDSETEVLRSVSMIDVPGHETLMAIMMSGAALIDGVLFIVAANEKCPQPQTKEHLMALQIAGIKNIIIVQNKVDLVDEKRALENYEEIKKFVKGTVAEEAPIIPISALHGVNLDMLLKTILEKFEIPKRDSEEKPLMLIARSFDVNKPGSDPKKIVGGVLGGVIKKGIVHQGDKIKIFPGIKNDNVWQPLSTHIKSIDAGFGKIKKANPGGNIGIETGLDPFLTKADSLSGSVIVLEGEEVPVWHELNLQVSLLDRVVGTLSEFKNEPLKMNENIMLNAWTAKTIGSISSISNDKINVKLKLPIAISLNEKITISRMINNRWRLVGYGIIL